MILRIGRCFTAALAILALGGSPALAQPWGQVALLTADDSSYFRSPCMVMDSLWQLHVFYVRERPGTSAQTSTLFYQRFDNWGHPLGAPVDLFPETHWVDDAPAVLLDREGSLHVLWSRHYWHAPPRTYYLRLSTAGEVLTAPYHIPSTDNPNFWSGPPGFFVQQRSGPVWFTVGNRYAVFSPEGELLVPLQYMLPESGESINGAKPAVTPDDQVWVAFTQYIYGPPFRQLAIARLDTVGFEQEVISPNTHNYTIQMSVESFGVDSTGVFHYALLREDVGLFYQRDARNGSAPDTVIIDPSPYGIGMTLLRPTGPDTLEMFWGQTLPQSGILRVGVTTAGTRAFGPDLYQPANFRLHVWSDFTWREQGYWIVGYGYTRPQGPPQVALWHHVSPTEPPYRPSAVPPEQPAAIPPVRLFAQPNPFTDRLTLHVPALPTAGRVVLYDLLGRQQRTWPLPAGQTTLTLSDPALGTLPSGLYFLTVPEAPALQPLRLLHVR